MRKALRWGSVFHFGISSSFSSMEKGDAASAEISLLNSSVLDCQNRRNEPLAVPMFTAYRSSNRLSSANKTFSTGSERLSPRATLLTKLRCSPSLRATRVYIPHTDSTMVFSFLNLAVEGFSFAGIFSWPIMSFPALDLDALEHFA